MSGTENTFSDQSARGRISKIRLLDRLGRWLLGRQLNRLKVGELILVDGSEEKVHGSRYSGPSITINVTNTQFYGAVAYGGTIGAADAYVYGHWACDDLTGMVQLLLRNRDILNGMDGGRATLVSLLRRILHWTNRNTKTGSRRNIAAHYDLGNEFFRLWLDETMMYSSAVFEHDDMTLKEASEAKLDRICQKLELSEEDHVLEIGTGWGGFALHAAKNYGCRVTTTTISKKQYEYAQKEVEKSGMQNLIDLKLKDYRDLDGCYDKIVSIEMIEAVGHQFMDTYFKKCSQLLRHDGMMLLQAITIADQRYAGALRAVDFIQKYIFPGGFLPSVTAMLDSVTRSTDMRIYHLEDIGPHYAETLKRWRTLFTQNLSRIREMGFGEDFIRMWHYYYCYCEGAFIERAIGDVQILFVRPGSRRKPLVPALGAR
ncbi:MAG: SAM-dependent methyltransferase [Woeseia sp.]|nr:SAM-dependent methyltransferase [Woeseia sp.]|tara:strand:- start:7373 stop:8659 length:1287 start_codon:yes stop_codon:yes gene_type:complete